MNNKINEMLFECIVMMEQTKDEDKLLQLRLIYKHLEILHFIHTHKKFI